MSVASWLFRMLPIRGLASSSGLFPVAALGPAQAVELKEKQRQNHCFPDRPLPLPEIWPVHAADRSPEGTGSRTAVSTGRFVAITNQPA